VIALSYQEGSTVEDSVMQQHIMDLKVSNAKLCTEVVHLTDAVSTLNAKMDKVTSALDTNKGAMRVFMALSGLIGAVLTYIGHKLFGF
jgi:uncharacterized protein YlxW (UPF0749 family)